MKIKIKLQCPGCKKKITLILREQQQNMISDDDGVYFEGERALDTLLDCKPAPLQGGIQ